MKKRLTLEDLPTPIEIHDSMVFSKLDHKTQFRWAKSALNFVLDHLNNKINKSEHNKYCYCKTDYKCLYCTHYKCCE